MIEEQVRHGVSIRMALVARALGVNVEKNDQVDGNARAVQTTPEEPVQADVVPLIEASMEAPRPEPSPVRAMGSNPLYKAE